QERPVTIVSLKKDKPVAIENRSSYAVAPTKQTAKKATVGLGEKEITKITKIEIADAETSMSMPAERVITDNGNTLLVKASVFEKPESTVKTFKVEKQERIDFIRPETTISETQQPTAPAKVQERPVTIVSLKKDKPVAIENRSSYAVAPTKQTAKKATVGLKDNEITKITKIEIADAETSMSMPAERILTDNGNTLLVKASVFEKPTSEITATAPKQQERIDFIRPETQQPTAPAKAQERPVTIVSLKKDKPVAIENRSSYAVAPTKQTAKKATVGLGEKEIT
ncbi:MAG: hypothetical protein GY841_16675, partial [FCB group bacterium]|nr:hypothetical protein [FCB group bacterium]